jgi:hypothetical protein
MSDDSNRIVVFVNPGPVPDKKPEPMPQGDRCPKCKSALDFGYGFACGGLGSYAYCENESCDFVAFEEDREGMDDAAPGGPTT